MPTTNKIIKKKSQVKRLIKYCKQTGYASVDFETNALPINHPDFYPTILGVSFQSGSSYIIPLQHFDSPFKDDWLDIFETFCKEIIENKNIIKIAQNLKFEYKIFKRYGYEMRGRLFDTMLAKYLLDEFRPHGLKPMVSRFLPEFAGYEEDYEGCKLPWAERPLEGLSKYCGIDCDATLRLMIFLENQLIEKDFYPLFRNMLMMGTRVLGDSEFNGMFIDVPYLEGLVETYKNYLIDLDKKMRSNKHIKRVEKDIQDQKINQLIDKVAEEINSLEQELLELEREFKEEPDKSLVAKIKRKKKSIEGREDKIDRYRAKEMNTKSELKCLDPINFNSTHHLRELFFKNVYGFGFPVIKYTTDKQKRPTDNESTDESVLNVLKDEDDTGFIETLLRHRTVSKLNSTYIVGIQEKVNEGRVHGQFNLHGTVTGRLSSNNPNLQNIPRDTTASDIKPMFVPPPGYLMLQLDYSQAELRVMAAMAGEKTMIEWFKSGKDIHLTTALKMYRQEERYDEIKEVLDKEDKDDSRFLEWKVKRKSAKTINFGIIYGQGTNKLAEALDWTQEEAQVFLREYFELFPKIREFIKKQHKLAHKQGYVRNVFGRKRRLINIDSPETWLVAEEERASVNAPIQGAASDYTLFSSILIWEKVRTGEIDMDFPQCYTVHDSLGFFVTPEQIHKVVPQLNAICENPETMEWFGFQIDDVKMKVDFEVSGKNWKELKTYDPNTDYSTHV